MKAWRGCVGLILVLLVLPATLPVLGLLGRPAAWSAWTEASRLFSLARNTLLLAGGTLCLALSFGVPLSLLLYRTDLPGRRWLRLLLLVPLFVPLPLLVAGWGAVMTASLIPFSGKGAAVFLHSIAVLPWVVLLLGIGLCRVERAMEEDALTAAPAWRVLATVTLRRAAPALAAASLWVLIQTSTEMGIADLYQVRTFAEEVNSQLVRPDDDASADLKVIEARAVAVSLPGAIATALLAWLLTRRWRRDPPSGFHHDAPLLFSLRRGRGLLAAVVGSIVAGLVGVPLAGLVWRAGLAGAPQSWSPFTMLHHLRTALGPGLVQIGDALLVAGWVGVQTATLALLACWLARESGGFRRLLLGIALLTWSLPGPLVGLGMKDAIAAILNGFDPAWLQEVLYHGPSWLPVVWVQTIRLLPFALAVLWPAIRALPRDLFETARVEGASPAGELRRVVMPLTAKAWGLAVVVVAALSLGEVSASKLVSTAGATPFAQYVFMELHYGVGSDLAARCLLLLAVVVPAVLFLPIHRPAHR